MVSEVDLPDFIKQCSSKNYPNKFKILSDSYLLNNYQCSFNRIYFIMLRFIDLNTISVQSVCGFIDKFLMFYLKCVFRKIVIKISLKNTKTDI